MNVRQKITELIGGTGRIRLRQINGYAPTKDFSTADYRYWDSARRTKARGLEISGLLLKPLASKVAAWVLGDPPEWAAGGSRAQHAAPLRDDLTGRMLNQWWAAWHPDILRGYEEALNLGDCYLVVNADLSVTVVPPHVVDPLLDGRGDLVGWRISETIPVGARVGDGTRAGLRPAPTNTVTVVDEYTAVGAGAARRARRRGHPDRTLRQPDRPDPGDPHCQPQRRGRVLRQAGRGGADSGASALRRRDRCSDTREHSSRPSDPGHRAHGDSRTSPQILGEIRAARNANSAGRLQRNRRCD